jgi:two-component system, chemotaxis family, sensor kinase CheA
MIEDKELLMAFIEESREHLDVLNEKMILLETAVKEGSEMPEEDLNSMFRSAHTIKGTASFLDCKNVVSLAHKTENFLQKVRDKEISMTEEMADVLFSAIDTLTELLKELSETGVDAGVDIEKDIESIEKVLRSGMSTAKETIIEKYLDQCLLETRHNLEDLDGLLLDAEERDNNISIGNEMFRVVHTIKGSAGLIRAVKIEEIAHKMEDILGVFRAQQTSIDHQTVSVLLAGVEMISHICVSVEADRTFERPDIKSLSDELTEQYIKVCAEIEAVVITGKQMSANRGSIQLSEEEIIVYDKSIGKGYRPFIVTVSIDSVIQQKDIKMVIVEERLNKIGIVAAVRSAKEISNIADGKGDYVFIVCSSVDENEILSTLSIDGVNILGVEHCKPGDIATEKEEDDGGGKGGSVNKKTSSSTIKVDREKLDKLMDLSGELVTAKAKFVRISELLNKKVQNSHILDDDVLENMENLNETTGILEKISANMQQGIMQTRLVPVGGVFSRFGRIVRDISKENHKEVNLVIEGAETELDKRLVDSLTDPLTHMIRNGIGHAIEDRETRKARGKPIGGTIKLKASHRGNMVRIEVSDDGGGIDPENLVISAVKKGLISEEKADMMTPKEKLHIIFMPGFSTASKVTNLSGRGVGMDVVMNMITTLQGSVDINSKLGEGTTFTISIPLTLAIINAMIVRVGQQIYAIPLEYITEILDISHKEIYTIDGTNAVKLRGKAISLVDLEKTLKVVCPGEEEHNLSDKVLKSAVVISDHDNMIGMLVDAIVGKEEIVIKPFTEHFAHVKGLKGVSSLADGNIALIVDPGAIIRGSTEGGGYL